MSPFIPRRKTFRYSQTNPAPPKAVFPLLCPVREAQWLEGWHYEMIFSESGFAEKGCIFRTSQDGEEDTLWVVTHYDRKACEIAFTRFTPGSRVCILEIAVEPDGRQHSKSHIAYTYTGLTPAGNEFINGFSEGVFLEAVRFWEAAINHHLICGTKLKREDKV